MRLLFLLFLKVSAFAVFAQVPVSNGLVAYYPFSGNANDVSGNNLHGVVMGANLTTDRFNQPNSAYHFTASDSHYILVPHDTLLNFSYNMSMAFWVYKESYGGPDSSTAVMSVLHKGRDVHNSYGYYTVDFTDRFYVRNFGADGANTDNQSVITLNNWHFVVGVLDSAANEIRYYVDGTLIQTRTAINFVATNQYPLVIGRHYRNIDGTGGFAFPFDGKIDDVRLYNRSLTNIEIQLLYNETCNGFSNVTVSDTLICLGEGTALYTTGGDFFSVSPSGSFTNDTLYPVTTTTYQIIVSKYNACADTHTVTIDVQICTGIEEYLNYSFLSVKPNPGNGLYTLDLSNTPGENLQMRVTDITGRLVLWQEVKFNSGIILDIREQPSGVYFIELKNGNNIILGKVIKQ